MNVAAHQDDNEYTSKSKAEEEEIKQSTDCRETECCPSEVDQRPAQQKNGLYEGSAGGN